MPSFRILILAAGPALAALPTLAETLLENPRDAAPAIAAAVAARDAAAIAALYDAEAILLGPGFAPVAGRDAIRAAWEANFAAGVTAIAFGDIRSEGGADRAAVVWTWTTEGAGGRFTGRSLVYFAFGPEGWKISADMWQPAP
jgi:ketosteroid isomerase-like protein